MFVQTTYLPQFLMFVHFLTFFFKFWKEHVEKEQKKNISTSENDEIGDLIKRIKTSF